MADRNYTVAVNVVGDPSAGQKAVRKVAEESEKSGERIRKAFGSALGAIGTAAGGALEPIQTAFEHIDHMFESMPDHAKSAVQRMGAIASGAGAAGIGIGALLTGAGSADAAAAAQLKQAIENAGASFEDYKDRIEHANSSMTKYGYTANQTMNALQGLTQATGDPGKALDMLGLAANLAAAKHEDLQEAVTQLNQILAGKGTKTLQQFGLANSNAAAAMTHAATAAKGAESADTALAASKQKLADLEARLGVAQQSRAVSSAAVTSAQDQLTAAQRRLTDIETLYAGKTTLTTAEQLRLSDAHAAVTAAQEKLTRAQSDYTAKQAAAAGPRQLTIAQQQELRNAQDAVTKAETLAQDAHKKESDAQQGAAQATQNHSTILQQLADKVNGQANAAADSWGGRLRALRAEIENQVATIGQKYGPAITMAASGMTVLGGAMEAASSIMGRLKTAKEADAAASLAGAAADDTLAASEGAADAAGLPLIVTIGLVVGAIAAIGIGIYELATHWSQVWGFIKGVAAEAWHWIYGNVLNPLMGAFADVINWIAKNWDLLLGILTGPIGLAADMIFRNFGAIESFFAGIVNWIGSTASHMWDGIYDAFKAVIDEVLAVWNWFAGLTEFTLPSINLGFTTIGGEHIGPLLPKVDYLAEGGITSGPMMAMIGDNPSGREAVIPLEKADQFGFGSGGGGPVQVVMQLDGKTLASATWPSLRTFVLQNTKRNGRGVGLS